MAMAIREDLKTEELNSIFKSLGARGNMGEELKEYTENVVFLLYGNSQVFWTKRLKTP